MSFGRRRFDRILIQDGDILARFLSLNLGEPAALLTEEQLRVSVETNRLCPEPLRDHEEQLALRAFRVFTKNPTRSPLQTATAQLERQRQQQEPTLIIVDPLPIKQRAVIERFRKLVAYPVRPTNIERQTVSHYDSDLGRAVLAICDQHFPRST